jgi:opacity protein-like surface antigen
MKRLICPFVILVALVLALPAGAQQRYAGVIGGLNIAEIDYSDSRGTEQLTTSRTTFGIGGVFGFRLNQNVCLELEPMYLQKGGTDLADRTNPDINWKMSFLEVPAFLKVSFGNEFRPYVMAGPTIGFLLSSTAEGEVGHLYGGQPLQVYKADLKDASKSFDFGIALGAGVGITIGMKTIFLDGRYTFGLVDLLQSGTIEWKSGDEVIVAQVAGGAELSTRGTQVMAGITFPFGVTMSTAK